MVSNEKGFTMKISTTKKDYSRTKTFLIARVSDQSQRDALPAQELRLNDYSCQNGITNKELHSFDESAYSDDRFKFLEIVDAVCEYTEKELCIMVFDKIDRLTRDCSSEIVWRLKQKVKEGKLELHFPSDGLIYHKNSPACDKTRLDMGMVFGGYYSAAISDNVKRRIEQKLHDGEYPGKACIGYTNIVVPGTDGKVKTIIPDPERKGYIVKIFHLRLESKSFRTIAKIMRQDGLTSNTKHRKPVGQSQICDILKNPFYYGVMRYDGGLYKHKYEPIISKQLFDYVQMINDEQGNTKNKTDTKTAFTFNGILKCAVCGCSISSYYAKDKVYMRCSKAKGHCDNAHTSEEVVMPQILAVLDKLTIGKQLVDKIIAELNDKHNNLQLYYAGAIKDVKEQYGRLEKRKTLLYEDRLDGRITVDVYDKNVTNLTAEMEKLDDKLVQLTNNDKSFNIDASYLLKLAQNVKRIFESSKPAQKNKILRLLLSNLELNQKKLQFTLLEPFSTLIAEPKSQNWLRGLGSNQDNQSVPS